TMTARITRDLIESYLSCKYKGHLRLAGQRGTTSDYELLLTASREEVKRRATDKILSRYAPDVVERNIPLTPAALMCGAAFLLNPVLEDDSLCLAFDGLQRVPGASLLGDYHYVPVLFTEGHRVRKVRRALLDVYALLLSRLQGRLPAYGLIWQ